MEDLEKNPFPDGQCRLILIGKTGNGKSSTGNSILGRNAFKPHVGINSGTQYGDLQSAEKGGLEIQVMDTPGLHDTEVGDSVIAKRITHSLLAIHPGPHAIILCLNCDNRFTREEIEIFSGLKEIFEKKMTSFLIVVFTKRDVLETYGIKFEQQLQKCSELKNLLAQANNRYILFDNRPQLSDQKKNEQVEQLLAKVREAVVQNGGHFFRHKLSAELNDAMIAMEKAEMKALDQDLTAADLHSLRSKPRILGAQEKEESALPEGGLRLMKDRSKSLKYLDHRKAVKLLTKQFEAGIPEEKLSQGDTVSEFQQKPPHHAASERLKSPTSERKPEQSSPPSKPPESAIDRAQEQELVKNFESLPKIATPDSEPPRAQVDEAAEDKGGEASRRKRRPIGRPPSFVSKVPDTPDAIPRDKQRMVEEALKRRLARGSEGLSEEQIEELERLSQSLGKKVREGMSKFAVKSIGQCRLM